MAYGHASEDDVQALARIGDACRGAKQPGAN